MSLIVVTGGRDFADFHLVGTVLDAFGAKEPITIVVTGACGVSAADFNLDPSIEFARKKMRGVDGFADRWAKARNAQTTHFFADWDADGAAAGPRRNGRMLKWAKERGCRGVIAFPGGAGTADCVRQALAMGLKVARVTVDADGWDVEQVVRGAA